MSDFLLDKNHSSWNKLKLLLWKNYLIQMRHKWQTVLELLLPVLFTLMLVVMRVVIKSEDYAEPVVYNSYAIKQNPPYNTFWKWYTPN